MDYPNTTPTYVPYPPPYCPRPIAITKRVQASRDLAEAIGDMAFGPQRRDDVLLLSACTASRIEGAYP